MVLLDDEPSSTNELSIDSPSIGAHQRIADTLSEIVKNKLAPSGQLIGLEGSWGSGKSTVIKILQGNLATTGDASMLVFDAWQHEGDPLKRSFLQNLINHVELENKSAGWPNSNRNFSASDLKKKLSGTKSVSVTRTQGTTLFGKITTFAVLAMMPVGLIFLQIYWDESLTFWGARNSVNKYAAVALIFAISPMIFGILFGVAQLFKAESRKNWLALFRSTNQIDTVTQETQSGDKTSIEFGEIFLETLIGLPNKTNKFVIAFDNLDRITPEKALEMWSSLQTFVYLKREDKLQINTDVFIIVPYDRIAISEPWKHLQNPESPQDHRITNSFLDKTFSLKFTVPQLMISDWRVYFLGKLRIAFPDHGEDDLDKVVQVYSHAAFLTGSPTPRDIKLFINKVGLVVLQWNDMFPLADIAFYFVLDDNEHLGDQLRTKDNIVPRNLETAVSSNITANLAGLLFNETPDKGEQTLLREIIIENLEKNTVKALQEIIGTWEGAFWHIFDHSISPMLHSFSFQTLANLASMITDDELSGLPELSNIKIRNIVQKTELPKNETPLSRELINSITSTCKYVDEESYWQAAQAKLESIIIRNTTVADVAQTPDTSNELPEGAVKSILNFVNCWKPSGIDDDDRFKLGGIDKFGGIVSQAVNIDASPTGLFVTETHSDALIKDLYRAINEFQFRDLDLMIWKFLLNEGLSENLLPLIALINTKLDSTTNFDPNSLENVFKALSESINPVSKEKIWGTLQKCFVSGGFYHHVQYLWDQKTATEALMGIYLSIVLNPNFNVSGNRPGLSNGAIKWITNLRNNSESHISELGEYVLKIIGVDRYIDEALQETWTTLDEYILKTHVEKDPANTDFSTSFLQKHLYKLCGLLDQSTQTTLLRSIIKEADLINILIEEDPDDLLSQFHFYLSLQEITTGESIYSEEYDQWLAGKLSKVNEEEWQDVLRNKDRFSLLQIAVNLLENNRSINIVPIHNSVEAWIKKLAANQESVHADAAGALQLADNIFSCSGRKSALKNIIVTELARHKEAISPDFMSLAKPYFLGSIKELKTGSSLEEIMNGLAKSGNPLLVESLSEFTALDPKGIKKALGKDNLKFFTDRLKTLLGDLPDDESDNTKKLRSLYEEIESTLS